MVVKTAYGWIKKGLCPFLRRVRKNGWKTDENYFGKEAMVFFLKREKVAPSYNSVRAFRAIRRGEWVFGWSIIKN